MDKKTILGLDLGTNSIGWAVVNGECDDEKNLALTSVKAAGSRIIPMDASSLGDFDVGKKVSQTAERTQHRGMRRLNERFKLRRERLLRVLGIMGFLPQHYRREINQYGHFLPETEPLLAWKKEEDGKRTFLFQSSFQEMVQDIISRRNTGNGHKEGHKEIIPYDWTIYYLRKKALLQPVSKEELAWILLHFNQKRGYCHARSEEKTKAKDEQTNKQNKAKEKEWKLLKETTESDIAASQKRVGEFIYDTLAQDAGQKIKGKLVATIERDFYCDELKEILETQKLFIPELNDMDLYKQCVNSLYPQNEAHRRNIINRGFAYLLIDDILFFHRPLKSKKSLIDNCPYECRHYKGEDGEIKTVPVKCAPKSHPLFQEFRLWQFIRNLRIYELKSINGRLQTDVDVTGDLLCDTATRVRLFDYLNKKKSIKQNTLLSEFFKVEKPEKSPMPYRWNYVEDREYPCNETRYIMTSRLKKAGITKAFLTKEREVALWHILYSVDDTKDLKKALATFASKNGVEAEAFAKEFADTPPFDSDYAAYSLKAISKLLPLMRMGSKWSTEDFCPSIAERINKLIDGEADETIDKRVRQMTMNMTTVESFQGLPLWFACYVAYGRHSEAKDLNKWQKPEDIDTFLAAFKQHSLRNPIVEQVVLETLRVVRDVWRKVGHIDEIHVELGREMKSSAEKRKEISKRNSENEAANMRARVLLAEFAKPDIGVKDVRPYSPSQLELLRIYEDGVWGNTDKKNPETDEMKEIRSKLANSDPDKRPTHNEIYRYKLWLEQKYRSPYTGKNISLSRLFTQDYEIEHVIPQSRYFDNSMSNKVICEAAVNKAKGNMLAHEFIAAHHGEIVELGGNREVRIFTEQEYGKFVQDTYKNNKLKMNKLLMDDLPDGFIERQLNDSRYISKLICLLLSRIVREEGEDTANSKHLIVCTGQVTDRLKRDWGANDVWNRIVLPRFERLNEMLNTTQYTATTQHGHTIPNMPIEQMRGFSKKRIDHRHHAMDAIVIACATRSIVNYLNNQSALSLALTTRHDLQRAVCRKVKDSDSNNKKWVVNLPWEQFPADLQNALSEIVVSFKQNLRIINKTVNHYQKFVAGKKTVAKQQKQATTDHWAIRKSLHKDTYYGDVNLRLTKEVSLAEAASRASDIVDKDLRKEVQRMLKLQYTAKEMLQYFKKEKDVWSDFNPKKIAIRYFTKETDDRYYATRKAVDTSYDKAEIEKHITDTGIQKIILRHLSNKGGDAKLAFSPEGIEEMNRNIRELNGGKWHQPILKVRWYEKSNKFAVGQTGNKVSKYVEADKGTNLFFAVSVGENEKRSFSTIPLNEVISRMKRHLPIVGKDGKEPLFVLSPGDLVYVPKEGETPTVDTIDRSRIYKMVSCNGAQCFFIQEYVASPIVDKVEFLSLNKMERAITGEMIKQFCLPLKVNRLGEITGLGY